MSTEQLQAEVSALEAKTQRPLRTTSLVASEDTAANPMGGVLENVPATIVAPVPGPPDFNGASAVVARLPNIGFAPSMLEEKGFESRGTFTVRQSRAGESFYLRIYGKLNHNIRCTIRGCAPSSCHACAPFPLSRPRLRMLPRAWSFARKWCQDLSDFIHRFPSLGAGPQSTDGVFRAGTAT
jgi:hypothetical protein